LRSSSEFLAGCYYYPDRDYDGYSANELQNRHVVRDRCFGDKDFRNGITQGCNGRGFLPEFSVAETYKLAFFGSTGLHVAKATGK